MDGYSFHTPSSKFAGMPLKLSGNEQKTEHLNSASHSLDDIMVCGLKHCSGSNISRKQHEMKLIFKLGTL